jgi:replicative DNA helicase|nr:MAG: ATP-dependent helicase [Caudoviricetes sp.]
MRIETAILKHLIYDEEYTRKVLPFLKDEYFTDRNERIVFTEIKEFIDKYNTNPTYESLIIQLNDKTISEEEYKTTLEIINEIHSTKDETCKIDWLIDQSEEFCKNQAIYNGLLESISIADGKNKTKDKGAIPQILSDALSVGFDTNVGHDFLENYTDRFEYYHRKEEKIAFDLQFFNKVTNGGFSKKTLNVFLAPPHSGKTLLMCHLSAAYLLQGKNVLYITLEMAEEEIAKRIDANLLNVSIEDLMNLDKPTFEKKVGKLKEKCSGKLIIKEYPTGVGSANHFRSLINELNLKVNFVPEVVIIDYLNICSSSRIKSNGSVNSYYLIKSISEEIRGVSQEFNLPIITATQTNKGGVNNSDLDMASVSESFALNATCDSMFGIINTEEMRNLNQILIKQIKNRYRDLNRDNKFIIGVDTLKMRLYDVEMSAQDDLINSGQENYVDNNQRTMKKTFEGFKV